MLNPAEYPPGYLDQVVDDKQAAKENNISPDTMRRLGPDGPPRIQLSPRRFGYIRRDLLEWRQQRRIAMPSPCPSERRAAEDSPHT
jgi:hypothetical protein